MKTKKLYITPSIEELSIEVNNIIATSGGIYPGEDDVTKDVHPELDLDLDREEEGFAQ